MPVARIVTRFPEEAAPLIARLRARGYTIEIVDPGTFRVTPADLEIELERLRTPEALSRAVAFAREREGEIFVAPGFSIDEDAARALRGAAVRRNPLAEGFKKLIERLQVVMGLHYVEGLTYREIAKMLDVSEPRVCQLHADAITKVRAAMGV